MPELDGKVAIVTGAGRLRGIGRAAAVALARLGANVVVTGTGRSPENYPQYEKDAGWNDVESTAEQVRAQGTGALPLVVDVTSQVGDTWFDSAGNFHSDAVHVVERYTAISPNALMYEATIEDPNVFTRPWTIRLPLYRRLDENMQLLEFKCVEFVEELMYGHLRKEPTR